MRVTDIGTVTMRWMIGTVLTGLFIALQSPAISGVLLIGLVFAILLIMHPVYALSALLILSPLRTLLLTEAPQFSILEPGMLGIAITFSVFLMHRVLQHKRILPERLNRIHWVLLIFILVLFPSSFAALSQLAWLQDWLKWLMILLIMVIVEANSLHWHQILIALLVSGAANALIGLYIFFGGSGADHLVIMDRFFRAFGTFGQPNPFGGFMGMILPIALMLTGFYGVRFIQSRTFPAVLGVSVTGALSLLMFTALIASWSRGAWLGFAAAMFMMLFAIPRRMLHRVLLLGASLLIITLLWTTSLLPASITARIEDAALQYLSFSDVRGVDITTINYAGVERIAHWQAAINMSTVNPWVGVGLGNYEIVYKQHQLVNWEQPLGHAHNYYLNILAEGGIIALLMYVILWIVIIHTTWQARKHPDHEMFWISIGLLGSWTYISVHSLIDNLYVNNLYFHIGVMVGLLSIISSQLKQSAKWRPYDTVLGYRV